MCDPLTAVAAAGAVASAGVGLYEGQQAQTGIADLQNKQTQANNDWVAYQNKIRRDQVAAEDAARSKATAAQQDTLSKVSAPAQEATQTSEQERLNTLYNKPSGTATDSSDLHGLLLSGEGTGVANPNSMQDLAKQVSAATTQARNRIGALATANSYGGSFGGLGTTVPIAFAQGGNNINYENAVRQGNLKTYGVQQQVQPLNFTLGPGTESQMGLSKGAMSLAGSLAGMVGPKIIGGFGGDAAAGAIPGSSGVTWGDFNAADSMGYGFS